MTINEYKEFTCVSMTKDFDKMNEQIIFLLENKFVPIIQQVEKDYIICVNCSFIEFTWIREKMPYNFTCPIRKIIEEKVTPVYYSRPFPKED